MTEEQTIYETELKKNNSKLAELLKDLINNEFYGKITLTFRRGKIVHLEKNESFKFD